MNTDSSVTIVTRLRPGRQKIHVSIAITEKRFLSTAQGANRMWGFSILGDYFALGISRGVGLTNKGSGARWQLNSCGDERVDGGGVVDVCRM